MDRFTGPLFSFTFLGGCDLWRMKILLLIQHYLFLCSYLDSLFFWGGGGVGGRGAGWGVGGRGVLPYFHHPSLWLFELIKLFKMILPYKVACNFPIFYIHNKNITSLLNSIHNIHYWRPINYFSYFYLLSINWSISP